MGIYGMMRANMGQPRKVNRICEPWTPWTLRGPASLGIWTNTKYLTSERVNKSGKVQVLWVVLWVVYELCFWHKTPQNFRESYVKFYHRVFYYVMQTILSGPHWHNQARSRYTHLGPAGNFEGCWGYCNGPMACHLENTLSLHGIPLKTNGATSAAGHWVPYHHSASPLAT